MSNEKRLAIIYRFFTEITSDKWNHISRYFKCKACGSTISAPSTSNLIKHLRDAGNHSKEWQEYNELQAASPKLFQTKVQAKNKKRFNEAPNDTVTAAVPANPGSEPRENNVAEEEWSENRDSNENNGLADITEWSEENDVNENNEWNENNEVNENTEWVVKNESQYFRTNQNYFKRRKITVSNKLFRICFN